MSKIKLPKRIAGVKIPKTVRKGVVGDFINSSAGQLIMAEIVTVAAAAFAARRGDLQKTGSKARAAAEDVGDRAEEMSTRLARALHAAVAAFREELQVDPEVVRNLRSEISEDEGKRGKKKSRVSRSTESTH